VGPIPKENLGIGIGYFATGMETEDSIIRYLKDFFGYIWILPRKDQSSIGIGSEIKYSSYLRKTLDEFIGAYCPHIKKLSFFSTMLPLIKDPDFYKLPCSGNNWILIGDAAGHVDPVTGEGILYAMWDGDLATQAIGNNDVKSYDELWWKEYGYDLLQGCKSRDMFYDPFMRELTVKLASRSRTHSRLLYDISTSEQEYRTFLLRAAYNLPRTMLEYILGLKVKSTQ
jgi:flavin-dependent dehydrogenase